MKTPKGTELPILNLKGKDYLMVAHRLVWFREERPEWSIETEFKELTLEFAIAFAKIRDEQGRVIATAHKREDQKHFPDYTEKAETGAIGRALAYCGFGTQFAPELHEDERIVDAPIERRGAPLRVAQTTTPAIRSATSTQVRPQATDTCPQCDGKMMVSQYNEAEFYCKKCRVKVPRA